MAISLHTAAQQPDLWERGVPSAEVWPEYNRHGDNFGEWENLDTELAEFQFVLYDDEADDVLCEAHTGPCFWDGDEESLSEGIDATLADVFRLRRAGQRVNTLCALAAEIPPRSRERRLAREILRGMKEIARRNGFSHLIAPVRPSWKERYPLTPIERYVTWMRPDGHPLDPWIRTHTRLDARISKPLPHSMLITGSVEEWESWVGMVFPETGEYVFPYGLAPVHIDREQDKGIYWEPNVWLIHEVDRARP
jgi:hypothetical protein